MMTWYQNFDGDGFINLDRAERITIGGSGSEWRISLWAGANAMQLAGVYASQADARHAVSQLCTAVDPTTITGV